MAIYNGTQKVSVSGIDKVYVGTQLVYQKAAAKVLTSISLSPTAGSVSPGGNGVSGSYIGQWRDKPTVTANYSDGTSATVTNYTNTDPDLYTASTQTITFSYTEGGVTQTANYSLTVQGGWAVIQYGTRSRSWDVSQDPPSYVLVLDWDKAKNGQYRVEFTMSDKIGNSGKYYNNGTETTTKPTSPLVFTISDTTSSKEGLVGVGGTGIFGGNQKTLKLNWYYRSILGILTTEFRIVCTKPSSGGATSGTLSLTTTKLEYYVTNS